MRKAYILALLALLLLGGSAQAAPTRLPAVDYNCDGEISVADALSVVPRMGSALALDLWAFDLDHDGAINEVDARIVITEIGRMDLPTPPWCEGGMTYGE